MLNGKQTQKSGQKFLFTKMTNNFIKKALNCLMVNKKCFMVNKKRKNKQLDASLLEYAELEASEPAQTQPVG